MEEEEPEVRCVIPKEGRPKIFIIEKPGRRTIEELKQLASKVLKREVK